MELGQSGDLELIYKAPVLANLLEEEGEEQNAVYCYPGSRLGCLNRPIFLARFLDLSNLVQIQ
jgi:hypothetical protein